MIVCLAATQVAEADGWLGKRRPRREIDRSQPFVAVRVPREPVHLGEVYGPNLKQVGANLNARVVANWPYHVSASFQGLTHENRRTTISPQHMTVVINGTNVPIGTQRVPIASGGPTPRGGVDVPIELQVGVKGMHLYPAGRYRGNLVITVAPGH
jgi:hypothetical protein